MKKFPFIRLTSSLRSQVGLTLLEVLIAVSIGGLIVAASAAIINQILYLAPRSENSALAVRQVQNSGYWISRDGLQAQTVTTDNATYIQLSFAKWDATRTTITYTYYPSNDNLQRLLVVTNEATGSEISRNNVPIADHITFFEPGYAKVNNKYVLTVKLKAQIGTVEESRTYKISPRSISL